VSLTNADLTWQFELRLPGRDQWVPITADMAGDQCAELIGTQEMPEIWQDAEETAPIELERVLADLSETGDPLGMTGARIVVWEGIGTDGNPACILEATADQLAAGRLEQANCQVQGALREVELARARVRAQIIRASIENRLSRNTIARLVSGALTRRLVLQLLAGYDLIEGIRDALQSSWTNRYRRWYPMPEPELEDEYLGPFCYGPVHLDLDPSGQVRLRLADVDGAHEPGIPKPDEDDDEEAERARCQALAERACGYAGEVLPLLAKARFILRKPDGGAASADDLVQTISDRGLLVSDDG
jgi:hypothetical protein